MIVDSLLTLSCLEVVFIKVVVIIADSMPARNLFSKNNIVSIIGFGFKIQTGILIVRIAFAVFAKVIVIAVNLLNTCEVFAVNKVVLVSVPAVCGNTVNAFAKLVRTVLASTLVVHAINIGFFVKNHSVVSTDECAVAIKFISNTVNQLDACELLTVIIVIGIRYPAILRFTGRVGYAIGSTVKAGAERAVAAQRVKDVILKYILAGYDSIIGSCAVLVIGIAQNTVKEFQCTVIGNLLNLVAVLDALAVKNLILLGYAVNEVGLADDTVNGLTDGAVFVNDANLAVITDNVLIRVYSVFSHTVDIEYIVLDTVDGNSLAVFISYSIQLTVGNKLSIGNHCAVFVVDIIAEAVDKPLVDGIAVCVANLAVCQGVAIIQLTKDCIALIVTVIDNAGITAFNPVRIHASVVIFACTKVAACEIVLRKHITLLIKIVIISVREKLR